MSRHRKTCITCKNRRATYALQSGNQLVASPILCANCTLGRNRWGVSLKVLNKPKEFSYTLDFHDSVVVYRNPKSVSEEMKEIFQWPVQTFNEYMVALANECSATAVIRHHFLSRRKQRLFILACLRELSHLASPELLFVFKEAEEFADNQELEISDCIKRATKIWNAEYQRVRYEINGVLHYVDAAILTCLNYALSNFESGQLFNLMVDNGIYCLLNIFSQFVNESLVVADKFITDTVLLLAKQIYETSEFGTMPILADALQDADCDNENILTFCRKGPWYRGNLVLDSILNKS